MARELAAWLREQAEKDGAPWDSLREATMRIDFDFGDVEGVDAGAATGRSRHRRN
jgi:hypothetical protein